MIHSLIFFLGFMCFGVNEADAGTRTNLAEKAPPAAQCASQEANEDERAPIVEAAGVSSRFPLETFCVSARAVDSESSLSPLSVFTPFELPPFWQRWDLLMIVLLAGYATITFGRYRTARLRELNAASCITQELTEQLAAQQIELGRVTRVLALDYAVRCALVESPTPVEAALKVLQTLCVTTGWDVGAIFEVGPLSDVPRCLAVWHKPATADEEVDAPSEAVLLSTGLAHRVLAGRRSSKVSGLGDFAGLPRASAGPTENLRSGFGFPLLVEGEITGVLELYSHEGRQPDSELIQVISSVSSHIGQLIKRKRAEDALSRSKADRLLELERVRRRIATDLHDDVGSGLTKIALLSEAVRQKVAEKNQEAADRLATVIALSNELVETMGDIVWAINPQKDFLHDLLQRMRRYASDILTACQISFRFRTPDLEHDIQLAASLRREVLLIFKECINNVVKHSQCSEVVVDLAMDHRWLRLSISDNGKGFHPALVRASTGYLTSQRRGGNGLASMRRRAREMNGQIEIRTGIGQGTTVTLRLPTAQGVAIGLN